MRDPKRNDSDPPPSPLAFAGPTGSRELSLLLDGSGTQEFENSPVKKEGAAHVSCPPRVNELASWGGGGMWTRRHAIVFRVGFR